MEEWVIFFVIPKTDVCVALMYNDTYDGDVWHF